MYRLVQTPKRPYCIHTRTRTKKNKSKAKKIVESSKEAEDQAVKEENEMWEEVSPVSDKENPLHGIFTDSMSPAQKLVALKKV
jgi:hypothetical protein